MVYINYYYMSTTFQSTKTPRKPLHIIIDERISKEDREIVRNTLEDLLGRFEGWANVSIERYYFYEPWCENPDQPYCRPQYYIETCRGFNSMVNVDCILNLSSNEPWQTINPHYDIYIIKDLIYRDLIYNGIIYNGIALTAGSTLQAILPDGQINPDFAGSVLSIGALRELYGVEWELAFFISAAHELGHLFGLPNPNSPYYINYNHPYAKENRSYVNHCSYEYCTMRQTNIETGPYIDLLDLAKNILRYNPYYLYCKDDWEYLIRNLKRLFG